jgi:hypothetical protein
MSSASAARPAHPLLDHAAQSRRAQGTHDLAAEVSGSGTVALPSPTKTGAGPAARNSSGSPGSERLSYGHR